MESKVKLILITTVSTQDHPGFEKLKASLDLFNWEYVVITNPNINWNWSGLPDIYSICPQLIEKGYTHFLYTDGFDTLALSDITEVIEKYKDTDKILFSAEKACFPRSDWSDRHISVEPSITIFGSKGLNMILPPNKRTRVVGGSRWRYLNHGQFIAPIDLYLELYNGVFDKPITCQEYMMGLFLNGEKRIELDVNCDIFQSIAFKGDDEYTIDAKRLKNNINDSAAVFLHANGRSEFQWCYDILGL